MKIVLSRIAICLVAGFLIVSLQSWLSDVFTSGGGSGSASVSFPKPVFAADAPAAFEAGRASAGADLVPLAAEAVPLAAEPAPAYDPGAVSRWSDVMDLPGEAEAAAFQGADRSPYIACWPTFDNCAGFTEIAVDFRADFLPRGTYVCTCQFDLDMSELQSRYARVYRDYEGVAGYAGFQVLEDGTRVAILSMWDTYCVDAAGNVTTLRAKQLYPAVTDNDSFGGEGTGAHCLVPYDWVAGHTYRMLLKEGITVADGQCIIALSVCDLTTGEWTDLAGFSTGMSYTYMKDPCSFLENFVPATAGQVRSICWSNYRVLDAVTGQWVSAGSGYIHKFTGTGSYSFGANDDFFWAITTGLPDRGLASEEGTYIVTGGETGSPY